MSALDTRERSAVQTDEELFTPSAETERRTTITARIARTTMSRFVLYYWGASEYFKARGAQSSNTAYKGSRSGFYYESVIKGATSLREMFVAREAFKEHYGHYPIEADEHGVLLRVGAYALRHVPVVGPALEERVREDDEPMVRADFTFPEGYVPITGAVDALAKYLEHTQQN